jgi:hypothetical protein
LTGTAEVQYAEWRDLLQQLFLSETGIVPETMQIYTEPLPEESAEANVDPLAADDPGSEAEEGSADAGGGAASGA